MLCAIMQPTYLSWAGYFDLMDRVHRFVFLDDAKVSKQSWQVRNRIRTQQGELYLTVPLKHYRDHEERLSTNTEVDYERDWASKHLKTFTQVYSKAPHFAPVFADLKALLQQRYAAIGDLNMAVIRMLATRIGVSTELFRSSELPDTLGRRDDRLVSICRAIGAKQYLSPQGSAVYIERDRPGGAFPAAGIGLYYHHFVHPEYPQCWAPFVSHMSVVDLIMNCGYAQALTIIRSGRREMIPYAEFRKTLGLGADSSSKPHSY